MAAFTGLIAKENLVGTSGSCTGWQMPQKTARNSGAPLPRTSRCSAPDSFLVFNLLDSPCLAAISTMSQEMNSKKWTWATILFQNLYAYSMCLMVYQFGRVFVGGEAFSFGTAVAVVFLIAFLYLLFRPAKKYNKETVMSVDAK